MVIKVYVSGFSASPEIRSYQQRSQFILDSLRIDYESIDITDPEYQDAKEMIKEKCKKRNDQSPKTPQFFNEDVYLGDYFDFEIASDEDRVFEWLGLEDTREEIEDLPINSKEVEGNENEDNESNINETIKTEIKDGILTMETVTKEESIIFSKSNVKTAPISVKLDDSGKEIIEFKDENGVIEEETCLLEKEKDLEIIRGDEEVVTRVIENKTDEQQKNLEESDLEDQEKEPEEENFEDNDLKEEEEGSGEKNFKNNDFKNQEKDSDEENDENEDLAEENSQSMDEN